MQKRRKYLILTILTVGLLVFVFGVLPKLSLLHGEMDIDLHSGRCLSRNYVCGIKISEDIIETPLSKMISDVQQQEQPPLWKLESEWSDFPMKYSKGGELRSLCDSFANMMEVGILNNQVSNEQKKEYLLQFSDYLEKADIKKMNQYIDEIASIARKE